MPQIKPEIETFAKIKVVGIGGSGGSAINRMIESKIRGVDFIVMNTDVQALHNNASPKKLHIGKTVTRGLGAGMDPDRGKRSAEESQNEIREILKGTDMIFITCGLGGGTGSGAAPVIAEIARDLGILTVAVVTKPFSFEGPQRTSIAENAHEELVRNVDAVITIPNDKILEIIDKKTSLLEAFSIVDDVLRQGVQGISEIITIPALINIDFADVKAIMSNTGSALMGIGQAGGENRAIDAAKQAISSPLLEVSIEGAKGVLIVISGGPNLGMQEVSEATEMITSATDKNVKVIWGANVDEKLGDDVKVTVVATGFDNNREMINKELKESVSENEVYPIKQSIFKTSFLNSKKTEEDDEPINIFTKKRLNEELPKKPDIKNSLEELEDDYNKNNLKNQINLNTHSQDKEDLEIPSFSRNQKIEEKKDNTEDLEIPAFLRKKMDM
jgi:cell division protein FtsZ